MGNCILQQLNSYILFIAGTIGDIGCFSLNDYKHISAGDGGMCIMNDEEL
jgi:dTDP-4-amino-4,6-dideoxygalactose transaminase